MQNNDEERKGSRAASEQHARLPPQRPAFRCPRHPKPSPRAGGRLRHSTRPRGSPCPRPPAARTRSRPPQPRLSRPRPSPTWERSRPLASRSGGLVFRETWARLLLRARDEDGADDERETQGSQRGGQGNEEKVEQPGMGGRRAPLALRLRHRRNGAPTAKYSPAA